MTQVQETHINSFYRELEDAKAAVSAAQSRVDQLKQAIRDRGGVLSDDVPVVDETEAKPEKVAKESVKSKAKGKSKANEPTEDNAVELLTVDPEDPLADVLPEDAPSK